MNESILTSPETVINKFNWIEYSVLSILLGFSVLIGLYYGCVKKNQNTEYEYMWGSKSMKVFPIGLSLIISHISGVTLLGVPAEVYDHGTQYLTICSTFLLIIYVTNEVYIPVFYPLQLNSIYEYLELRFSRSVRIVASAIFATSIVLHTPVVVYIPALAVEKVIGVPTEIFVPVICFICIFYTSIGGLKTVVWTDAFQGFFTLGSVITVIIIGIKDIGGYEKLWAINEVGQRIEFLNMNPSLLARNTFYTVVIGGFFQMLASIATHPGSIQRFMALPTIRAAKQSVMIYGFGLVIIKVLAVLVGLNIYAKYHLCDPVSAGLLKNSGKLVPHYVQEIASSFPGLTGIFIAGLISAALSTMSAGLNTLAGTLYEDFFSHYMSEKSKSIKASFILKMTVVSTGCIIILMVYIVQKLGSVLQVAISLHGITQGSIMAVFTMGVLYPRANKTGALWGMVASLITMTVIVTNAQLALATGHLKFATKPMQTSGSNCTINIHDMNSTDRLAGLVQVTDVVYADKNVFHGFLLSYMYYTAFGTFVGMVVGIIVSWLTNEPEHLQQLNPELITPLMRRFLPKKKNSHIEHLADEGYRSVAQEEDAKIRNGYD
ncbi:hypothetical protein V9T40_003214 [Parthenolecanium corni]|uniref:Sodium-coupled monocarboxylate transporter 1 n=1 Tax=Parthenolecanium corni TaxID=536013 RepID=A0AAN9YA79_9HEMI